METDAFCINESVYGKHLSYGQAYKILDNDLVKNQYLILGDLDKSVWIPHYCFAPSNEEVEFLESLTIDDQISDPINDIIEVTLTLSSGARRWCTFCTPAHLQTILVSNKYFSDQHTVFVPILSKEAVEESLDALTRQGELMDVTRPL